MNITNNANLPQPIVAAVLNDPYPHGKTGDISVTSLIKSPRQVALTKKHWQDLEEDVADRIWALLGQSIHTILERADAEAITEDRLFAQINGWTISGQFDRLVYLNQNGQRILQDYKLTSVWSVINGAKTDWIKQLNVLAWLAKRNAIKVDKLEIVAILRDWSKTKARQGGNYPQKPVAVLTIPKWTEHQSLKYVLDQVGAHQHAQRTGILPDCTADERWERDTTWAVKKPGRKTAVRVCSTLAEAERIKDITPKGYIEERPGTSIRCEDYCPVAAHCDQWQRLQETQSELSKQAA